MSDKITSHHQARKAILYIRQSSAHQVQHNLESQRLQYAMQDRLQQLGWREIKVVDDDLGRSAAGLVARAGCARMVAEVCLGQVGAVAAREVSRFARNSREWQQLAEVCRVVDTVLRSSSMRAARALPRRRSCDRAHSSVVCFETPWPSVPAARRLRRAAHARPRRTPPCRTPHPP